MKQKNVLLVEENVQLMYWISRTLMTAYNNLNLRCVPSAEKAQEVIAANPSFDLIIVTGVNREDFLGLCDTDLVAPLFISKSFEKETLKEMLDGMIA